MSLVVNIIGAGRLGQTIGRLLVKHHLAKIAGVRNRSLESSMAAIQWIGDGQYFSNSQPLPLADIIFITTPDDHICETSIEICRSEKIKQGSIFIHCSGVLTSDIMSAAKRKGALVASVHPMGSFSAGDTSVEQYAGTYCAMEGDIDALQLIEPLFQSMGFITHKIAKEKKSLYHAAGVFVSNYLVTLAENAFHCLCDAGVEEKIALNMMVSLMKGTISNIETSSSPKEVLTGPINRGDLSTIKTHVSCFSDDKQRALYRALGKATIALTSHDQSTKERLETAMDVKSV